MESNRLKSITEFCRDNGISRSTFYNLAKLGRGPEILRIGGRRLVSPEAERAWRQRMACEPIEQGLRSAADAIRAV
jgi:predicted DNA-binding transcriptional regulator AlpA